jgi:hypothetical protein
MLKRVLTATCLVVFAASVAMAQTPPPSEADQQKPATQTDKPQYDRPQTDKPSTDRGRSMTWTGCLQKATEGTGFVLTSVTEGARGTSGTPTTERGTTIGAVTASSYRLVGTGGQDLSKHVGHKIEVSGSIAGRMGSDPKGTSGTLPGETPSTAPGTPPATTPGTPPSTTPPETTPPSTAASPMAAGKDDMPRLNVKSIKHVSETCP